MLDGKGNGTGDEAAFVRLVMQRLRFVQITPSAMTTRGCRITSVKRILPSCRAIVPVASSS